MRERIRIGLPVVSWPYIPAAEIPIPCWPRLCDSLWNFEPYSSLPKIFPIWVSTTPGPLSSTIIRKRFAAVCSSSTEISGRIPASSHASSELSTASFTAVSSDLSGESNPRRWRFLVKNSETEISRCRAAIDSASLRRRGVEAVWAAFRVVVPFVLVRAFFFCFFFVATAVEGERSSNRVGVADGSVEVIEC